MRRPFTILDGLGVLLVVVSWPLLRSLLRRSPTWPKWRRRGPRRADRRGGGRWK
jgi:hypothetical protein